MPLNPQDLDTTVRDAVRNHARETANGIINTPPCHCCEFIALSQLDYLFAFQQVRSENEDDVVATYLIRTSIADTIEDSFYVIQATARASTERIPQQRIYLTEQVVNGQTVGTQSARRTAIRDIVHSSRQLAGLHIEDNVYAQILPLLEETFPDD